MVFEFKHKTLFISLAVLIVLLIAGKVVFDLHAADSVVLSQNETSQQEQPSTLLNSSQSSQVVISSAPTPVIQSVISNDKEAFDCTTKVGYIWSASQHACIKAPALTESQASVPTNATPFGDATQTQNTTRI